MNTHGYLSHRLSKIMTDRQSVQQSQKLVISSEENGRLLDMDISQNGKNDCWQEDQEVRAIYLYFISFGLLTYPICDDNTLMLHRVAFCHRYWRLSVRTVTARRKCQSMFYRSPRREMRRTLWPICRRRFINCVCTRNVSSRRNTSALTSRSRWNIGHTWIPYEDVARDIFTCYNENLLTYCRSSALILARKWRRRRSAAARTSSWMKPN